VATILEEFLEAAAAYQLRMTSTSEMVRLSGLLLVSGIESPSIEDLATSDEGDLRQEEVAQTIDRIMNELGKEFVGQRGVGLLAARKESKRIVSTAVGSYEGAARLAAIANGIPDAFPDLSVFLNLASDWGLSEFRDDVERDIVRAAGALLDRHEFKDLIRTPPS
jgi:hypothetical protein